jgi:nucleoside-diphosphate-sugar epimerase
MLDTVMNRSLMAELVDRADVIFHPAAAVGVRLIVEAPVHTIETNIKTTEVVLELAARKKKPVLLSSTSEVYGKLNKEKFSEEDDLVLGPTSRSRWCYAASKIIDEFLAKAYWKERKLPTVVVQVFNTIGPRQTGQYGMVVPRFVRQALRGGAHHRLRRRDAAALLHLGRGRGGGHDPPHPGAPGLRRGLQRGPHGGDLHLRAGLLGEGDDGERLGDRLRPL